MKMAKALLLSAAVPALAAQDSPVGKAIQLLSDLQTKIITEGEGSQKVYSEFSEWCEERSKDLSHEIKTGKAESAGLQASIAELEATEASLGAKIETLAGEISVDEADLAAARSIRASEQKSFSSSEHELTDVISTLQRAVGILEREQQKGGASMLQMKGAQNLAQALEVMVHASMLSTADAGKLTALVQSSDDDSDVGAPAAAYYESHSGNIVDVLGGLLEEAEGQLDAARKKETQDVQAFELMEQALEDELKNGNKIMAEAKAGVAAASEKKAGAQGDLGMTSKELASNEKGLGDLHHECMTRAEDFEAETKSRGDELKALAAAKAALKDNTGAAADLSYSFLQTEITSRVSLVQFEAARFVRDLARKEHSTALAQLAARMTSVIRASGRGGEDVFGKVKGLVRDLIERLEKEHEQDATKKAFCDKELAETNQKKAEKTAEIAKLSTSIDQMAARSAQLKEETAALQQALSQLATSQAEMNKIRAEEKETFASNKADMEQGLKGVKLALRILNEYYASNDKAHASADGAGSGIIGLLEVVESDMTKGLAEMTATEESSASAYDAQTKENEIERATKEQDTKYKSKESTQLDQSVSETSSDRSGVQAELGAVQDYLQSIEAQCIDKAESYAERHARFEAEIAGLKQALEILQSETAFLQRGALRGVHVHRF